jgi:hypothetical protein
LNRKVNSLNIPKNSVPFLAELNYVMLLIRLMVKELYWDRWVNERALMNKSYH